RDERLASCLAQSKMAPEAFVPDWMPGLFTPDAPPGLIHEYGGLMFDFHPSGFRTMANAVAEADLRPALPSIELPVLLLHGEDDQRSPAHTVGADLAAQIPQAKLLVIPRAGHLCNAEQPEAFNAAIREFAANL
ncbi:MAG TPA: alpha/beta fold hydrolase, partial [Nocardioidaceae bacterium]|nr:alpha/beta fold hydrolase [Nocardioidaceae bacterium]